MSAAEAWCAWRPLPLRPPPSAEVLAEILDGGQAFRWKRAPAEDVWQGIWHCNVARLRLGAGGGLEWRAPEALAEAVAPALADYLDAGRDARDLADALPWRSDPHLARCLAAFPGLRLLRQPFGETLLGFLCSSTKRIPQIKRMLAELARRHGSPLGAGAEHGLPSWPRLAEVPEAALRACGLGFRARHIRQAAQWLAERPGWLEATAALPYAEAKARLIGLPGVGEKIADCALLFGAGRLEAFPVDVWILRAMAERYGLRGWKPADVAHFGRVHFGDRAGLAQQYLFAWERAEARK